MKKCPYCGKEYPDDVESCLTDNELLLGDEQQLSPKPEEADVSISFVAFEAAAPPPAVPWTDHQFRIFEVVLVCVIAFGTGVLSSGHSFFLSRNDAVERIISW
jgi:hypothetical protein